MSDHASYQQYLAELRTLAHEMVATDELFSEEMRQVACETAEELYEEWKSEVHWSTSA